MAVQLEFDKLEAQKRQAYTLRTRSQKGDRNRKGGLVFSRGVSSIIETMAKIHKMHPFA